MKRQLTALALVAGLAVATVAIAKPQYGYIITYYSDASYTTVVGDGEFTCAGKWKLYNGVKTDFYLESNETEC
ncbi:MULTISPECIES: hypothetical protein [Massilia]|uniref:Uncharacterized protein n=1 Tax=Massilia aurea TaxID=373040 RepID=A0A422QHU5_9BURK|nr:MULTISPECIES: hypothetical protein [Massilia]MDY0963613.1 hypothetical protein [Massilia sp. CFBP9026]RNF29538.1 hypothetical protein NM04_17395 [Massilia aurea]